jgi:hypothetical protein
MSTPTEVVSIAKISEYLWNDTIPKEKGFFNGTIDPRKPVQLYMERIALQYGISQNLDGIPGVANYVYALCGAKLNLAKEILANGSSGGTVIPGGGGYGVREYGSFASAGQTSIVFNLAINATLLYASRSANTVTTILTSGTPVDQQVVWDTTTGTLTFASNVPFYAGEYIRILVK